MDQATLNGILDAIDAANAQDPNTESTGGVLQPAALLYGRRMSGWLTRLRPDAPPALQIAARAQHVRRWEHPRDEYPKDRRGYLSWRRALYSFHAGQAAAIMAPFGVDQETVERVSFLLHKKQLHDDPDTQALEDAACLVFLEFHLGGFAEKTDREKLIQIIRKTWRKMSGNGHQHALRIEFPEPVRVLVTEALGNA